MQVSDLKQLLDDVKRYDFAIADNFSFRVSDVSSTHSNYWFIEFNNLDDEAVNKRFNRYFVNHRIKSWDFTTVPIEPYTSLKSVEVKSIFVETTLDNEVKSNDGK